MGIVYLILFNSVLPLLISPPGFHLGMDLTIRTASLFSNGVFWVSVVLGGVGIAAVVFVIIYRKKIAKKPKVEGNTGVEEDE